MWSKRRTLSPIVQRRLTDFDGAASSEQRAAGAMLVCLEGAFILTATGASRKTVKLT